MADSHSATLSPMLPIELKYERAPVLLRLVRLARKNREKPNRKRETGASKNAYARTDVSWWKQSKNGQMRPSAAISWPSRSLRLSSNATVPDQRERVQTSTSNASCSQTDEQSDEEKKMTFLAPGCQNSTIVSASSLLERKEMFRKEIV